jgi:uncharacterized protein YegL
MTTVPLILSSETVAKVDLGFRKARTPFVAVVYATADGEVVVLDGGKPMAWSDQVFPRYRYRYEVDISDHTHTIEIRSSPLPAMGGINNFHAQMSIGFRVVDPAEVVRRRVSDGLGLVSGYIIDTCRRITLNFRIEEFAAAEEAINSRFARGVQLAEGIELYLCRARLSMDSKAMEYLGRAQFAQQDNFAKHEEHKTNVEDAARQAQLAQMRQLADLNARALEQQALAGRQLDVRELIAIHLERNPNDTERALQLLAEHERARLERSDIDRKHRTDLFKFAVEHDLLQAVDVKGATGTIGDLTAGPSGTGPVDASGWDDPLPRSGATFSAPPAGLLPIYLVLDASDPLGPYVSHLNEGLRRLYERLRAAPEAAVVRLSVFGYSDDIQLDPTPRLIAPTDAAPLLSVRGQPHLGPAFRQLVSTLPRDVEQLKAQASGVRRPQVLFLSGAQPTDTPAWETSHDELAAQRYAPDIAAFGVGAVSPEAITRIATRPELAYVAGEPDPGGAITAFFAFVGEHIVRTARAVIDGEEARQDQPPAPFRPAR